MSEIVDVVGQETLEAFAAAPKFNRWLYSKFARYVGYNVLEIGAGLGNITECINAGRIIATDYSDGYVDFLTDKFAARAEVMVWKYDLVDTNIDLFADKSIDTVICSNVLEHVEDDRKALQNLHGILAENGRLVLLVPYSMALYCEYDRLLGHYRRYTRRGLRQVLEENHFVVRRMFLFNFFGGIGWFVTGKILKRSTLAPRSIALFETLVPLLQVIEKWGVPFGASLVCVAEKVRR
jgi:SAM-dependent methyltransferase